MNLLFVFKDGRIATPRLTDTILEGVTRDSVLTLARDEGLTPEERPISIEEWREASASGELTEVFACGTAAVITPVGEGATEAAAGGGAGRRGGLSPPPGGERRPRGPAPAHRAARPAVWPRRGLPRLAVAVGVTASPANGAPTTADEWRQWELWDPSSAGGRCRRHPGGAAGVGSCYPGALRSPFAGRSPAPTEPLATSPPAGAQSSLDRVS